MTNPKDRLTGAIHVYGGDFVHQPRSQWGPGKVEERPYDIDEALQQFTDANATGRRDGVNVVTSDSPFTQ